MVPMLGNTTAPSEVEVPVALFSMMGVWACLTGVVGAVANGSAIALFIRSKKVRKKLESQIQI